MAFLEESDRRSSSEMTTRSLHWYMLSSPLLVKVKYLFASLLWILAICEGTEEKLPNGEYIYRLDGERLFEPEPQEPCPKPVYPLFLD